MRVIVADDQSDVLEALRLLLAPLGFKLTLVTSLAALLEHVRATDWDLVLMDLNYRRGTTSGEEGLELLSQLRNERSELPVVVMTAWADIDLAVRAMRGGAKSFVEKPWDNRRLVQVLEREIATGQGARQRSVQHEREQRDALLIQRALMPETLPSTPRIRAAVSWSPAGTLGGDCYDMFTFGDGAVALSIADVAGKGLPAALLMSSLQAAVRAFAHDAASTGALCTSLNRLLCGQMIAGRFVTMAYLRLDVTAGSLAFANAGHNPPMIARTNGSIDKLEATGTVLGVFPDADYQEGALSLDAGDRIVLYTDGITEARDSEGQEFGDARLADVLLQNRQLGANAIHDAILESVTRFASPGFQDDATLLVVAIE